jgi:hypothetical protein
MSTHHLLRWKDILCKSLKGDPIFLPIPQFVDHQSRGKLLSQIIAMQKQNPIDLVSAVQLISGECHKAYLAGKLDSEPGHYFWYTGHFIDYISGLGYHIELTGDEFEPLLHPQSVA